MKLSIAQVFRVFAFVVGCDLCFAASTPVQVQSPPAISTNVGVSQKEIDSVRKSIDAQSKEMDRLRGEIDLLAKKKPDDQTALWAALGAVIAAFIAGGIALWNQNKQASQERLLKAVEIIMQSRSGHQADNRRKNLEVFLDQATKKHLVDIKTQFSGPEFTDLHISLAMAMSEKAATPEEVLRIWRCVLKEKNVYNRIAYPE